MSFGNSGQRGQRSEFQRSRSLTPRSSNLASNTFGNSSSNFSKSFSQTKSITTSSSSTYKSFSSVKEESVFGRNLGNRSSINKPEPSALLKQHFNDSVAFTNTEKGNYIQRQPFRTTLNSPTGLYSANLSERRNGPPLTGTTFSGLSPLTLPRYEPPPIPLGSDAVKAQSLPVSPPKKSGPPIPVPLPQTKVTINPTYAAKPTTPVTPMKNPNIYDISKKGFAMIFNNEKFDGDSKDYRVGSRNDEKELQKTLGRFNIEVKVERDPSLSTIEKKVKEISKMDFKKKSCLFVCILSHGNQGQVIFAKDRSYNLDRDVIEPIIRNVTLVGKPKIFIVQACKGATHSVGYAMMDATPVSSSSLTKPSEADILILYSSYEGRVSYRMAVGSIFIQKLCTFINSKHRTNSLEEIMKETRRDITENSDRNLLQTPTMVSTLTKDFYFSKPDMK